MYIVNLNLRTLHYNVNFGIMKDPGMDPVLHSPLEHYFVVTRRLTIYLLWLASKEMSFLLIVLKFGVILTLLFCRRLSVVAAHTTIFCNSVCGECL